MPEPEVGNALNTVAQLQQRIACNRSGSHSFAQFVIEALKPRGDDEVLDIGAGLGAQLIPVAERVLRSVGLDVSPSMVAELKTRITAPNVNVIVGDMDNIHALDLGGPFTLAYAVYSLYYSRDPGRVVKDVAALLRGQRSRFVSINPDIGNNAEWLEDLGRLYEVSDGARDVVDRVARTIVPAFLETFPTVTRTRYLDCVRFTTLDTLMAYYDACAPYCRPDKRDVALRYFGAKFERDGSYEITKCSLALVGTA